MSFLSKKLRIAVQNFITAHHSNPIILSQLTTVIPSFPSLVGAPSIIHWTDVSIPLTHFDVWYY
jgi:hypothetical protein